jgi:subtilisin family serine protease
MSLGFQGTGAPDANGEVCAELVGLNDALQNAYDNGVTVVAAAGNDGGVVSCPAAYPTVISVAATGYLGTRVSYSNQGDALDVAAPGGDPDADLNGDGFSDGVVQETYCDPGSWILFFGNFDSFCDVLMSGTSMATPHVSGLVALLLGEDSTLSPDEVRQIIESTARDRGAAGWDPLYGHGLIDAEAAALMVVGSVPTPTSTNTATATNTPIDTSTPTNTATATNTPTSGPPTATPTATPCSRGSIKKGTCGSTATSTPGGGGTPTATPTCKPRGNRGC